MAQPNKQTKSIKTFTEEQVMFAVAEAIADTAKELDDVSLIIAGALTMSKLRKKLHK